MSPFSVCRRTFRIHGIYIRFVRWHFRALLHTSSMRQHHFHIIIIVVIINGIIPERICSFRHSRFVSAVILMDPLFCCSCNDCKANRYWKREYERKSERISFMPTALQDTHRINGILNTWCFHMNNTLEDTHKYIPTQNTHTKCHESIFFIISW